MVMEGDDYFRRLFADCAAPKVAENYEIMSVIGPLLLIDHA